AGPTGRTDMACVDPCHFPTNRGIPIVMQIPAGYYLYVSPDGRTLFTSANPAVPGAWSIPFDRNCEIISTGGGPGGGVVPPPGGNAAPGCGPAPPPACRVIPLARGDPG